MNNLIIEIINGVINEIQANPDQLIYWGYLFIFCLIIIITNIILLTIWVQTKIELYINKYKKTPIKGVLILTK